MKRIICTGMASAALLSLPVVCPATDAIYENFGALPSPAPTIDARAVVNHGSFVVSSFYPYDTSGTLNYTNYGIFSGNTGFRFETVSPTTGLRTMASSFINHNPGVVEATAGLNFPVGLTALVPPFPCYNGIFGPNYLYITATNIVTGAGSASAGASIIVGAGGEMRLRGKNVDLSDSGILVNPVMIYSAGSPFGNGIFLPDVAIEDIYWAQTNFSQAIPLGTGGIWDGATATAPGINMPPAEPTPAPGLSIFGPAADSYSNWLNPYTLIVTNVTGDLSNVQPANVTLVPLSLCSNIFKGAIFSAALPDFGIQIGFTPSFQANNFFNNAHIEFSTTISNITSGGLDVGVINIRDYLASDTRLRGNLTNLLSAGCNNPTKRPANYFIDRIQQGAGGLGNFGYPDANFFTAAGFRLLYTNQVGSDIVTNRTVDSGEFAGYAAYPDSMSFRPPVGFVGAGLPGTSETNYPGRIEVEASDLNLENTRIRGEGLVTLKADNLVSSVGTVIDCENISFDLNSISGSLKIDNLVPDNVSRLRGPIYMWSAVWTNQVQVIFTNNYLLTNLPVFSPPGSTNIIGTNLVALPDPITNFCAVGYAATFALANLSSSGQGVSVFDAVSRARHTEIDDNVSVVKKLTLTGRSLTVNGSLRFPGVIPFEPLIGSALQLEPLKKWTAAVAPQLLYLTNNGTISVSDVMHLGDDRTTPYVSIVNTGTVTAAGISIRSEYLQNNGTLNATFGLRIDGNVAKLEGSKTSSGNVTRFDSANVKFNGAQVTAGGALEFNVAESITEADKGAVNQFNLNDGFLMERRPKSGSLLRSIIQSTSPSVPGVTKSLIHTWAAADFGASAAGYQDNMAIGTLALVPGVNSPNPHWWFGPSESRNAMYVDLLDLSKVNDVTNHLHIQPNMVIYYAALKLGFTPPPTTNGIPQLPEEFMDGAFAGRLRWVPTFAGPNSSVAVVLSNAVNGPITYIVNRALANSKIIDSDGDGIPNADDGVFAANGDKFSVSQLGITIAGNGTVSPDVKQTPLIVGQNYTFFAVPNEGSQFVGWTGSITSSSPQLSFTMQSNLALTATFSYTPIAATYRGLAFESEAVRFKKSGAITLSTTTARGISGTLQFGGAKYSFKGQLDSVGAGVFQIPRPGDTALSLEVQAGDKYVTGRVGDGVWSAGFSAGRNVYNTRSNPAPNSGKYTIIFPGTLESSESAPRGSGYGAVTINASGTVQLTGALGDGTKISVGSALTEANQWSLYSSLYGGKGQVLGWVTVADVGFQDMGGETSWIKQSGTGSKLYPDGFDTQIIGTGSRFNPLLNPLTGFASGQVRFAGDGLTPFFNAISIGANNKVINLSPNKLTMKLSSSSGTFSGSTVDPETGRTIKFNGALHQKLGFGAGFFPGTVETGEVKLGE